MPSPDVERLRSIKTFPSLVKYLRDELDWPIETDNFEDLYFEYEAEELGIDAKTAAKIQGIKQLRPLESKQPWGIFFVMFEPKRLPVVALRRILSRVVVKKRASASSADRAAWQTDDLLFVSNYGEGEDRRICFAHFAQDGHKNDLPTLKVLGWDNLDTPLHLDHVADVLAERLTWPEAQVDTETWRKTWRSAFTLRHKEVITTSKALAVRLADLARGIRDRINTVLAIETENGPVTKLMGAFKGALVHDLDEDGFADMYAQTIAYGLLSARVANPSGDTADDLAMAMPVTNPFLKELMETFLDVGGRNGNAAGGGRLDFDELGVSEVVELLDAANMEAVVCDFGDKNPQEDPVIHFYELFLKEYDAKKRMQRGVFYTPRPVVSFIVRSVDELLRTEFGLEDGLADTTTWGEMKQRFEVGQLPSPTGRGAGGEGPDAYQFTIPEGATPDQAFVQILDPATGTGTFLVEVIDVIHRTMVAKWKKDGYTEMFDIPGLWNDYVPKHLLPRIHGYELMMAPYAIAHMKIGLKLYETGYRFGSDKRAQVYLTNALEPPKQFQLSFDVPALAHEAEAVNSIKRDSRFTVVIGNPPYARSTSNRGDFIEMLMLDYKEAVRSERNIQPLSDDYIKFLRFAHYLLKQVPASVLGMITNGTYISGRIHRGVRESVRSDFSAVRILNLHGSARTATAIQGTGDDENVFDILQGVAISLWCRGPSSTQGVLYSDLVGPREYKYARLLEGRGKVEQWRRLKPIPPHYLWIERSGTCTEEFSQFMSLEQIFGYCSVSGKPGDDSLLVSFDKDEVVPKLKAFKKSLRSSSGNLTEAGRKLAAQSGSMRYRQSAIVPYAYRPFDTRWTYYDPAIWTRALTRLRSHVNGQPILLATKLVKDSAFAHVFVTREFPDVILLSNKSSVNCYSFPLGSSAEGRLFRRAVDGEILNLDVSKFPEARDFDWDAEAAFNWIYAILYSADYRRRYFELLQYDFPRVPVGGAPSMIKLLSRLGGQLVSLHLMESPKLDNHLTARVGSGDFYVEKVSYSDETVWIDRAKTRGFRGVPEEVWNFHIGGYQVCEKWLKDRQAKGGKNPRPGRVLTDEDIAHYQKIVVALAETIRIMAEIDKVIDQHGGWPGAFAMESSAEEK